MVLMATTQIPLVTQVSDIGNVGRMRLKSNVKLTDVILRLEARVTILESLFMCAIPLSHHLAHMTHPFPSPPKQASSTPPLCQPCKLESRDMTCFNPCTLYGHRLSFEWMDGYGGQHFYTRTMGAPRLTSSLNMLQEIGRCGSLRFPFRNNIYHNPGEHSVLW